MKKRKFLAFTLVELMVVILIIAILAALVVPRVLGKAGQAKVAGAQSDVSTLAAALQSFRLDCDRFPTTEEGLAALTQAPSDVANKWKGPYLEKTITNDPWGHPYHYSYPGQTGRDSFDLLSYGSDGQQGGDGDAADVVYGTF